MPLERQNCIVREALQKLTLKVIYDKKFFYKLAFSGGAALRILHNRG
jgi:hypothetical protein